MPRGKSHGRRAGLATIAAAALSCALAPSPALASRSGDGVLSPRLAELAKPSVRTAPPHEQARELSLAPEGAGSLLRVGNRVLVDVRFGRGAAASVDDLRAAGARIVNVSRRYQTVTVAAKPAELGALSSVPDVVGAKEVLTPIVASGPVASVVTPCFGAATSEGDQQLRAAEARKVFDVDGSGVTVGILSDSFDADAFAATGASEDIGSGDLPGLGNPCGDTTPVDVLDEIEDPEEGADEGRAMAQIVHDLAPGADLAFASAFNGEDAFAENIERLAEPTPGGAGAQVIADDVFYLDEPFFQDGPVAVAVNKVAGEGVAYFSAAGNDNLVEEPEPGVENSIASWEAPSFRDAGGCPAGVPSYAIHCMDFNPGAPVDTGFQILVEPESTLTVDLQWSQPWHGVTTDLDAYLLRNGVEVAGVPEEPNASPASQEPVEILSWDNTSGSSRVVTLAIDRCNVVCGVARGSTGGDSGTPLLKFALLENGGGVSATEYPTSGGGDTVGPTIFGHSGAAGAVSVGAVPFFTDSEPEPYSSHGPVTHYFGPVEGPSPASAIPPETLAKPNVVATDGGANTFFGSCVGSVWRFFGTSAAAPHAAAVAALELDAEPSATAAEAIEAQEEEAAEIPLFGADAVGSGLVDAFGAVGQVLGSSASAEPASGPGFAPPDCSASPPKPPFKEVEEKIIAANPPAATEPPPVKLPRTFFRKHPPHVLRTSHLEAKAVFRFGSDQGSATFTCRIDGEPFRACPKRFVGHFDLGPHILRVKARDAAGNVDPTPAVYRFKVKRLS
jgi:hypothetical protein